MRKLMIVDDEPLVRSLIRGCIDWSQLGIEISCEAQDAVSAMALLGERDPDIACVDICMPGKSGIELTGEMLARKPNLRIVVISGHDTFEYAQQCLRLGVSDYLLKPINEEQLICAMRRVLASLPAQAPQPGAQQGRDSVRQVMGYLREHYQDPDLSLHSVARAFYMNASYLSRAIKQDTGRSYVETLTAMRMEAAQKLLLETDLTGYEVAECVGIPDAKYFGACFKRHTGQAARDFRRSRRAKR